MSKPTAADIEWKSAAINSLASRLDAAQEEIDTQAAEIKRLTDANKAYQYPPEHRITVLTAEIKRLRDALEQIAASTPLDDEAVAVAQAALKEQDK